MEKGWEARQRGPGRRRGRERGNPIYEQWMPGNGQRTTNGGSESTGGPQQAQIKSAETRVLRGRSPKGWPIAVDGAWTVGAGGMQAT